MFRMPDGKKVVDATSAQIFEEINNFLKQPRYDGDSCIVLTMPANVIAKSAEKLNSAIYEAYKELEDPKTGMTRILVAIEAYMDVDRLAVVLDNDIKMTLAKEHGIDADEDDLDKAKTAAANAIDTDATPDSEDNDE